MTNPPPRSGYDCDLIFESHHWGILKVRTAAVIPSAVEGSRGVT